MSIHVYIIIQSQCIIIAFNIMLHVRTQTNVYIVVFVVYSQMHLESKQTEC